MISCLLPLVTQRIPSILFITLGLDFLGVIRLCHSSQGAFDLYLPSTPMSAAPGKLPSHLWATARVSRCCPSSRVIPPQHWIHAELLLLTLSVSLKIFTIFLPITSVRMGSTFYENNTVNHSQWHLEASKGKGLPHQDRYSRSLRTVSSLKGSFHDAQRCKEPTTELLASWLMDIFTESRYSFFSLLLVTELLTHRTYSSSFATSSLFLDFVFQTLFSLQPWDHRTKALWSPVSRTAISETFSKVLRTFTVGSGFYLMGKLDIISYCSLLPHHTFHFVSRQADSVLFFLLLFCISKQGFSVKPWLS